MISSIRGSESQTRRSVAHAEFHIFGALPDIIHAEWIDDIELLDEKMAEFIERKHRQNAFDIRYNSTIDSGREQWK